MIDYEKEFARPPYADRRMTLATRVFAYTYGWMAAGLALSGAVAWLTYAGGLWRALAAGPGMLICLVLEIGLVIALGRTIDRLSAFAATALFLAYAALNGLTLSVIFVVYQIALIQTVFFVTAGMFAGLAVFGTVTRSDLSGVGAFCGMALWGVIIASVVNLFLGSSGLDWLISFVAILVFTGLTMYDARRIGELARRAGPGDEAALRKAGLLGALALYLDFVNLFLHLLRLFGRDR